MATQPILTRPSGSFTKSVDSVGGCNAAAIAAPRSTIATDNGIGGKAKYEGKWKISLIVFNGCGATAKFVIADWLRTRLNASVSWPWQISIWYVENCCC